MGGALKSWVLLLFCGIKIQSTASATDILFSSPVVPLNSWTFNKTINAFPHTLVHFTQQTRPEDDSKMWGAFEALATEVIHEEKILMARVTIPGFGRRDNHDLAQRFGLADGHLPEFILLSKHEIQHLETRYGADMDLDQLRKFLQMKTGIKLSLPGCVPEMDVLAQLFARNSGKEHRLELIQQTENLVKSFKAVDADKANVGQKYLKIMKICHMQQLCQDFVSSETSRLKKLLSSPSTMSLAKSQDVQINLNILKSFEYSGRRDMRDEL